jgi:hypothetical protein
MHGVHRHLLLVKDIADVSAKNEAAIARDSYDDDSSAPMPQPPAHDAGFGPGALAQKPTARQPGGDRALNAPNRANGGGSDPNVADPVGKQPAGSKQFTREGQAVGYTWNELAAVIDLCAGPPVGLAKPWLPSKEYWAGVDNGGGKAPADRGGDDEEKLAGNSRRAIGLSAETGRLASTPAPRGKPGGPGLYGVAGNMHSPYLQNVVKALIRKGTDPSKAYAIAWSSLRKWSAKSKHPEVRAAAAGGLGLEKVAEARAHAHAGTWDEVAGVIALTGDGRGNHIPGTPMEWEHGYVPLTPGAAASHFRGKPPAGWKPRSGGGGKTGGPAHLKFTSADGKVSYHTVHDPETAGKIRDQAKQRGMTAAEGDAARDSGVAKMPKNAQAMHDAAVQAGWNVSHYPGSSSDFKFDAKGHEIPGSGTQLHAVTAHNPVTGKTVRQSWTGNKVDAHSQKEPLSASIAAIKGSPVTPEQLKALGTPAGRDARTASRIGDDATEFSARGTGTNAQKVGYLMGQASEALRSGDKTGAISLLKQAQTHASTGHEVMVKGLGYAPTVIGKHLQSLGAGSPQQFARSWDEVAAVIELAAVSSSASGGRAAQGGQQQQGGGRSAAQQAEARVPAGQAGGGRFGSAGGATPPPDAHQQHLAHLSHVAAQKAGLMATAAGDRAKASALMRQRAALVKALASAGGKTSGGQAGAKTTANATTGSSAPATATPAAAAAAGPAATATAAKTATAPAAPVKAGSAAAMKAQIAGLNTQIAGLLAAADAATAQAAKM